MCITSGLCVAGLLFMPGDSVAKFTWRNSAYLSGSKCITFVICIYSFCFFDRVSSILTSLALTILHCSNYCHVETIHPHQKYIATVSMFATDNSVRQYTFGGGDGNRTHVHNNFQTTSTNSFPTHHLFYEIGNHYNIKLFRCQPSLALLPLYWHQLVLASP